MYLVVALVLTTSGLCALVDVYITGNQGAAIVSSLLFTAAVCTALCQLASSLLMTLSMIFIVVFTLGLSLLVELRKFARKREAIRKTKLKAATEQ